MQGFLSGGSSAQPTTLIAKFVATNFATNVGSLVGGNPLQMRFARNLSPFVTHETQMANRICFPLRRKGYVAN
jgi:hypothetical protein